MCWCSRPVCYRCVRYCSLRVSVLVLQASVLPLCAILQSQSQCVGAPGRCVTTVYCSLRVSVLVLQAGVLPLCEILQSPSQCVGAPGRCVTAVCDTAVPGSVCWCSRPVCYRCVRYCSLRVSVLVLQAGVLPLCEILQSPSQCVGAPGRCVTAVCDTTISESVCWCSRPVCYRCVRYCSLSLSVLVLQAGVLPLCTAVSESVCWCSRPVCYRCVRYCSLRVSVLVLQAGVLPLCEILQSPSHCVGAPGRCVTAVCDTAVSESVCWCSRPVCYRCVRYCSLRVSMLVFQAGVLPLCTAVSESVCWCSRPVCYHCVLQSPSQCVGAPGRCVTAV